ncbi:MAG TPA: glycosyltransferase family 4 protein [Blastocatellia bacterium]
MTGRTIKLLAIMEASSVTGPAKNLLEFCRTTSFGAVGQDGPVSIRPVIATFVRETRNAGNARPSQSGPLDEGPVNDFVATAARYGIEVHTIKERFRFDPRVVSGLQRVIGRVGPDVVQTHGVKSHFLMRLSGAWHERAWLAFHHGYTTTDAKMRAFNQLDRWSLRAARQVVTVSHAMANSLAQRGVPRERIAVIHNSIRSEEFIPSERRAKELIENPLNRAGEQIILSVGRLSLEKGHIELIKAVARLRQGNRGPDVRLIVVGDGPELGNLKTAVERYELSDIVIFAGQVSDVKRYYEIADVLALPSRSEGSPNVVLEAMAAGVPVVATRVGGVPEIINSGTNGILVPEGDPGALASAIGKVLSDREMSGQFAINARRTLIANHSTEARSASLIRTYLGLIGGTVSEAWS